MWALKKWYESRIVQVDVPASKECADQLFSPVVIRLSAWSWVMVIVGVSHNFDVSCR